MLGFRKRFSYTSQMSDQSDIYATSAVPLSERRDPLTMGLLWITMITAFPAAMIGFEWYKKGLTFTQVLTCTTVSCLLLLIYSIPATQLGAKSGLSYTALSRLVFGRWGSWLITFNVIWLFTCAYGLIALYFAESMVGLFHWHVSMPIFAAVIAILMCGNNVFGFKGVANFARYIAAPSLIVWIVYTFCKALGQAPPDIFNEVPHQSFSFALTTISSFVIGFGVWGNEMDYWRFSQPKVIASALPLAVAVMFGQVLFPAAGWLVARITGVTEYSAATALMNDYSFGGIPLIAAIVLGASYVASNDSNLFGCAQACENFRQISHRRWTLIIAVVGALCASLLSVLGVVKSLEILTALNCIVMPTPTVIMVAEWLLMTRVFKTGSISNVRIPDFDQVPPFRTAAVIALISGLVVGVLTSGVLPGTGAFVFGVASVQAWVVAFVVYLGLRLIDSKNVILHASEKSDLAASQVSEAHSN